ncbi:hypothetical protein [Granulicella sp. dw_53]|uniref:hypothetical protein n=1 Tax=Granulicella sp. dw_53 TaxID=2719792 RepID=UPI001BD35540|nr:hypothetical protein [Granulicella sp. dw_53]
MRQSLSAPIRLSIICSLLTLLMLSSSRMYAAQSVCGVEPAGTTYSYVDGDMKDSQSLQLTRSMKDHATLQVIICAGKVLVVPALDGRLHLSIELQGTPAKDMTSFVRAIESQGDNAIVSLAYPKNLHPHIVLRVPLDKPSQMIINLGTGELSMRGDAIQGDCRIDVGIGKLTLYLRGDSEYSKLDTHVGLGSFRDHRSDKATAHLSTQQLFRGKGGRELSANVGIGSMELRTEE